MAKLTRSELLMLLGLAIFLFGNVGVCRAGEFLYQFTGAATAFDGTMVDESFTFANSGLLGLTDSASESAGQLMACSISNDSCDYVSLWSTGPGDPAGHPEVEIGGFNAVFDYYLPYGALGSTGSYSSVDLGTGNGGELTVSFSSVPEPSTSALFLFGLLLAAVFARRSIGRSTSSLRLPIRSLAVISVLTVWCHPSRAQSPDTVLDYTTSWIGNSFGGGNQTPNALMKHVPIGIDGIYVTPDGKVYTNTSWDEGGRALTTFSKGDIVNPLNATNENNGGGDNAGGAAVAADSKYIYESYQSGSGVTIKNVGDESDAGVSLTGSTTLANSSAILGMTIWKGKLYLTENDVNKVEIFDTSTLALTASLSVQNPARIAVDSSGAMWISHNDTTLLPFQDSFWRFGTNVIDRFDASGRLLTSLYVQDDADVTALWIDEKDRLFIGDNGTDQNIKVYTNILKNPVLAGSFGAKGGVFAGADPGKRAPMRFHGITGVGTDALGNIYVAENGFGPNYPDRGSNGHGAVLQAYTLGGKLEWNLEGLEFVTMGGIDPALETDYFDAYHRFVLDYSKPAGQQATYFADTVDPIHYPGDIRLTKVNGATAQIQHIRGRKFLFVTSQAGGFLAIFRFDPTKGEVAIPCGGLDYGAFQAKYNDWDYQPMNGEFIWRDLNGDGATELNEFLQPANTQHVDGQAWWPDSDGNIWQVAYYSAIENSIHFRRYKFQGFDSLQAPIYDYKHVDYFNVPAPLTDVGKINFFPDMSEGGTLFLGGSSNGNGTFTKTARYDHWDLGNRKPTWVADVPWDPDPANSWDPNSFAVAGDYMFVDFWVPHYVEVYSAKTGQYVGRIQPGDNVGGPPNVGNTDVPESIEAYRRPDGEYVISQEEDYQAKNLLYLWTPSTIPTYPKPPPPTGLSANVGVLTALTWDAVPGALTYTVSRGTSKTGPFTPILTGVTQPNTNLPNVDLTLGKTYYYVVSYQTETGLSANSEPEGVVAAQEGSVYPAVDAVYTSPSFYVGCPACFGGGRVGDVAPGVTITFTNVSVATAGAYAMQLWYVNGNNPWSATMQSPTIDYSVNNLAAQVSPGLVFTGDWNTPGYISINVPLTGGTNTIVLSVPADASGGTADIVGLVIPSAPI